MVFVTAVHPSRPVAENTKEFLSAVERCTVATQSPRPVDALTPYAIPLTENELTVVPLFTTPIQSIPLYEYRREIVIEVAVVAPAIHNPRPFSSRPYAILLILAPALILAVEPRIGVQFIPSVEYTRFAVVSIALVPVDATPPATKSPLPNAIALHRERIVSEFGTSLQLIPS